MWIPRALVLDCPPVPPPPPADPAGTEGDRRSLIPGDEIPNADLDDTLITGAEPPSAPREIPLERVADMNAADADRVDVLVDALGLSRKELIDACVRRGKEAFRRWRQKLQAARLAGEDVEHCGSPACKGGAPGLAVCPCDCPACVRRAALLAEAEREVDGGED
jgi:hypothetical protein